MYLIIDIGNTLQKVGIYDQEGNLLLLHSDKQIQQTVLQSLIEKYCITHTIISNVGSFDASVCRLLQERTDCLLMSPSVALPIAVQYRTPETLGSDRIAGAVAVSHLCPHTHTLLIQAGSCLVMDFIDRDLGYCGGSIAPGVNMRLSALHHFTQKLPKVDILEPDSFIGQSTEESILCGTLYGITDEIEGAIQRYQNKYGEVKVVLTGGDMSLLQKRIKYSIFAAPNLVLYGLYKILEFNAKKI